MSQDNMHLCRALDQKGVAGESSLDQKRQQSSSQRKFKFDGEQKKPSVAIREVLLANRTRETTWTSGRASQINCDDQ